ncbi:biotin transporter BioY [Enorma phocaeensis]|uniref:Biotin transporter n=1 Tax=Enorma phocaeensis TaxID=1871019 RepID=A0ABT7VBF5_9ACTN|nr:biotin transporter BioY [Enorma phocaeensis]MDM8275204.1 biotin transporter BioY [Enorma phocaeensis]
MASMNSREIARIAVCVALLAVSSWVSIPLGPVPFTLQTMVLAMLPVVLAGRGAAWAVGAYLVLGGIGFPVFAGFMGGVGVLCGPTGGYLVGFLFGELLASLVRDARALPSATRLPLALVVLLLTSYVLGTAWFVLSSGSDVATALLLCVVPFAVPDVVKMACGAALGRAVRHALAASRGAAA